MNGEADFVITLSSDSIAKVMEVYFNESMFKQEVTIIDLKPVENGYTFAMGYVIKEEIVKIPTVTNVELPHFTDLELPMKNGEVYTRTPTESEVKESARQMNNQRRKNGRFTKVQG